MGPGCSNICSPARTGEASGAASPFGHMLSGPALAESSRHLGRTALHLNVKAGYSAIDARDERLPSTVDLPAVLRFLTQGAWCAQETHFFFPHSL